MLRKIKKFSKLSAQERNLFLEAYYTLGIMRAAVLSLPFKRLVRSLEHRSKKGKLAELGEEEKKTALAVGKAIEHAAAHTPWESACMIQALTAQRMLKKRGVSGVFYLGVAKDKKKMKAHAWSQCGDVFVTGGTGHEAFTVVSVFKWGGKV